MQLQCKHKEQAYEAVIKIDICNYICKWLIDVQVFSDKDYKP